MCKIIHLIPYDGIGGVEAAARSMAAVRQPDLTFEVNFLFPTVSWRAGRRRLDILAMTGRFRYKIHHLGRMASLRPRHIATELS